MKIGFIGLGAMGAGIARNILKAGHELTVWNRSQAPVNAIVQEGARAAADPAETLKGDMVFTMLANDVAYEELGFAGPILQKAAPGLIHVNMATIAPATGAKLAAAHATAGIGYLASPVFGRPDAAAAAKLILVVGGQAGLIEKTRPVLNALGWKIAVAGDKPEAANLLKIAGNFMTAAAIEVYGEAFALLRKSGVDPEIFYETMSAQYYSGSIHKLFGRIILDGAFDPPGFKLRHGYKDIGLVLSAGKAVEAPLPVASLVHDLMMTEMADGKADIDWSVIADLAAKRAGLKAD